MKTFFFITIIILFCAGEATIRFLIYPMAATDFNEWVKYMATKDKLFDTVFFLFSFVVFQLAKNFLKALAAFMVIMTGGSFIDKVLFGLNHFLWTDIFLVIIGVFCAYIVYKRNHGRPENLAC